jgi:hypothetical protein
MDSHTTECLTAAVADTLELFRLLCNGSVRLESRTERLTGDAEFLLLREGLDHTAVIDLLALRLEDPRDPSLLHANVAVIAQGCGDQNDAAAFRCKSWTLPDGDRAHRRDAESQSPCPNGLHARTATLLVRIAIAATLANVEPIFHHPA